MGRQEVSTNLEISLEYGSLQSEMIMLLKFKKMLVEEEVRLSNRMAELEKSPTIKNLRRRKSNV